MTDPFDDAARDLVRRAHDADPHPGVFDPSTGLADVLARSAAKPAPPRPPRASLTELVTEIPEVTHAVIVSVDGHLLASSDRLPRNRAEQVAAISAGLISMVKGASRAFEGGTVNHTIVKMAQGYLVVVSIGNGSGLAVLATPTCDLDLLVHEVARLSEQVDPNALDANLLSGK